MNLGPLISVWDGVLQIGPPFGLCLIDLPVAYASPQSKSQFADPFEHGEVFVLDDGGEVDLDLGNYKRFLDVTLTRDNNITTGKIYQSLLDKEGIGDWKDYSGCCTINAIKTWIESVSLIPVDGKEGPADVYVIELGGTVGDS